MHQGKAQADSRDPHVRDVIAGIFCHPLERVGRNWNWKSAVLSSLVRSQIFFLANLQAGVHAALGAMAAELAFRAVLSGYCGSLTEAFRRARPSWAATLSVMVLLPIANHALELLLHWARGTPNLKASMIASVSFTAVSSAFNLFAMREGTLIVGPDRQTLWRDLTRLPGLFARFLFSGFGLLRRLARLIAERRPFPLNPDPAVDKAHAD